MRRVPVVESHRLVGVIAQADVAALTGSREAAGMLQSVSEPAASQAERRAEEET